MNTEEKDTVSLRASDLTEANSETTHKEMHLKGKSDHLKVIIFGGLDGILTMFSIVSGCAGASVHPLQAVCVSLASLLASAFSMGYGEYVSGKAERDYLTSELEREKWEVEFLPDVEKKEMLDIYTKRYGFSGEDANSLVEITFKHKDFFLRNMMVEELGIMLEDDSITPIKRGLLMGSSFFVLGTFPLLGFFSFFFPLGDRQAHSILGFITTMFFSLLGALSLGFFKGAYTKSNRLRSSFEMGLNGVLVGLISYLVGTAFMKLIP